VLLAGVTLGAVSGVFPLAPALSQASTDHPSGYVCYRVGGTITIDGRLDEAGWQNAPWSESFVDILGRDAPAPAHRTRFRMLWDDDYLYVAAVLEEPHVWATLTERDAVMYHDDDFEVFLDPDGDTHGYYEIEINAFGAVWDLFLVKPYRDGGPAISAWDIRGLRSAVVVDGTLNEPSDTDRGWTVELAIPWSAITETAPGRQRPSHGDQWRVNFSRVDWEMDIVDGTYHKRVDPATSRPVPEHNWVWSPQGAVNMHMPEQWGSVQFSETAVGTGTDAFVTDPDISVRQALRAVYHAQRAHRAAAGRYAEDLQALQLAAIDPSVREGIALQATALQYTASRVSPTGTGWWHIREDGRVWHTQ
jgi:hypothetical protein